MGDLHIRSVDRVMGLAPANDDDRVSNAKASAPPSDVPAPSPPARQWTRGANRKPSSVLDSVRAQRDKILRQLRQRTFMTDAGCLEWEGCRDADKRARITIRVDGRRIPLVASRVMWALHHGEDPKAEPIVRIVCENPACINVVEHCALGTLGAGFAVGGLPAWDEAW